MGVGLLHAGDGVVDGGVSAGPAVLETVHVVYPFAHAVVGGTLLEDAGAEALDGDDLGDIAGADGGVLEGDGAAEGVADEGEGIAVEGLAQGGHVEDELGQAVLAADGPLAVAVAAQVDGVDGVVVLEGEGHTVPVAGVVAAAVDEEQGRVGLVAPDDVVQLESLRLVVARFGFHRALLPPWMQAKAMAGPSARAG